MKYINTFFFVTIFLSTVSCGQSLYAQKPSVIPVYVIVHGTWGGGWAFKEVDSLMSGKNSIVYRPTLTGQGERVHLASNTVGLDTHIMDIVNTVLFEDLHNIILVGHSYGGMVVTGVANKIPERISKLVYLDAVVPENNESLVSVMKEGKLEGLQVEDGFLIPKWVSEDAKAPKDVPHSLKTWTDAIILNNPDRLKIPTTYILTVEKGKDSMKDAFASQAERAKSKSWPVLVLESNHNAQWDAAKELSNMLLNIGKTQ